MTTAKGNGREPFAASVHVNVVMSALSAAGSKIEPITLPMPNRLASHPSA